MTGQGLTNSGDTDGLLMSQNTQPTGFMPTNTATAGGTVVATNPKSKSFNPEVMPKTMTREQALDCVLGGLNRIKDGLIAYYALGLTSKDLESDLKEKGWQGSSSSLRYHVARLREQGMIPPATKGARPDLKRQPLSPQQLDDEPIKTIHEELKLFDVTWVKNLQDRESELMKKNEELQSKVDDLELEINDLKARLKQQV